MSGRRIAALFRRVVQEIRRDRPSLALLFVAPILVTGLVTFILREGDTPTVHAVVVNQAGAPGLAITNALSSALQQTGNTVDVVADDAAARARIQDGSATVAITLSGGLVGGGKPTVTVLTNGLDPSGEGTQIAALQKALGTALGSITGAVLPTIERTTLYGTPSTDPITNFAPAIVGFFAYFFVYLLTGISFLRERTGGTLERLMATPVARGEVVAGYTLGFGVFATVQVALLMVWTLSSVHVGPIGPLDFWLGLGVPSAGNPLLAFLVVVITALGAVSLGIFLSAIARTELQILQFIPLVIVPQFLLSGVLFPVSSLPGVLQPLVAIMPLHYAVEGLRQVFIAGADLGTPALQVDLLVAAVVAAFFATIASLTIRRDIA